MSEIVICILSKAATVIFFFYSYTVLSLIKEVHINTRGKYIWLFWK
jgi:hypothetical protein